MATKMRTSLFSRRNPGGVWTIDDLKEHPGDIFFVDSGMTGATDGAGFGLSPDAPFATLDYAVSQCTASQGDVIYLMPGHAETISTAALSPGIDVAGVRIVGLGQGALRPTFTFTHVDGNIIVSATSCSLENVVLLAGVASVVELVDVDCADFIIKDCELRESGGFVFLTAIDITGAGANVCDGTKILNCKILQTTAGAVNAIEIGAVHDRLEIVGNYIQVDASVACISSASICTNLLIRNNLIHNVNAGDWAIELTGAATGMCVENYLYTDALATSLDPGSLMNFQNYAVKAVDEHADVIPAA